MNTKEIKAIEELVKVINESWSKDHLKTINNGDYLTIIPIGEMDRSDEISAITTIANQICGTITRYVQIENKIGIQIA